MKKVKLDSPKYYINRELSWIQFNNRVLQQGLRDDLPLAEKLKFLAIVSSNLDEFFMIRVAGLMQQRAAGIRKRDISGLTPIQQLNQISTETHKMVARQDEGILSAFKEMSENGVELLKPKQWNEKQRQFLKQYFIDELLPALTPLAMQKLCDKPVLQAKQLNIALTIISGKSKKHILIIPIPVLLSRFIRVPGDSGIKLALIEDVIADNAQLLCNTGHITNISFFRITRDADVGVDEDEGADLLESISKAVLMRRRRSAVRVEISSEMDTYQKNWLSDYLQLKNEDIYKINSLLDATALFSLAGIGPIANLKIPDWPQLKPIDLLDSENIFDTLKQRDVMLFHPYESFDPVVDMIQKACEDPGVIAIKQTLYRTSGDSPIIAALEKAALNGKEVTVLVELKARFDEAQNVNWARRLEDAGCHVIYGIANLKTHAKALLIIKREESRICRYVHLATGNYNDKTAKLYSDIGLMTTDKKIASDVTAFFNLLTGYSETVGWHELTIAPTDMKKKFIDLIEREIQSSSEEQPGLIMAKTNSLQDVDICKALFRASQAGVKIKLNVRGICCLRPAIKGVSKNIEVSSIVDRYLEHARVFYFKNGGHDEVYMSSADWMKRNLDKRLELLFPVKNYKLKKRLMDILNIYFKDNINAQKLNSDGSYSPIEKKGKKIRAQENFYNVIKEAVNNRKNKALRFRPITQSK